MESLIWTTETDNCNEIIEMFESMKKNSNLEGLILHPNTTITQTGWESLARLICNLEGENATSTFNHTMRQFLPLSIENCKSKMSVWKLQKGSTTPSF